MQSYKLFGTTRLARGFHITKSPLLYGVGGFLLFKCLLYLACFSGQILTGGQRIHITDILSRIRQGICRSRIADAEAVHRLYQLILYMAKRCPERKLKAIFLINNLKMNNISIRFVFFIY